MPAVAVLAATSLGASACNFSPYAAKVNGAVVSQASLNSDLKAIASNSAYAAHFAGSQPVHGKGPGTFSSTFAAQVLFQEVSFALIDQELARRHVSATPAETQAAKVAAQQSVGGIQTFSSLPSSYRNQLVNQYAAIGALEASVGGVKITNASLRKYYDSHRSAFVRVCSSFVVTQTSAEASAVRSAILAGAPLASAAGVAKVQGAKSGVLGCGVQSQYSAQLGSSIASQIFKLAPHQVSTPISLGTGSFGLVQVTSKGEQSFASSTLLAESQLLSKAGPAFGKLMTSLMNNAKLVVNPLYGRVATVSGNRTIVAPSGPPASALYKAPGSGASKTSSLSPTAGAAPSSSKSG